MKGQKRGESSSLNCKKTFSAIRATKGGVCFEGSVATKKLVPRLSFRVLLLCNDMESKKMASQGIKFRVMRGDTPFALVTPHFSSARELTGTKLAMTCVKKVLSV